MCNTHPLLWHQTSCTQYTLLSEDNLQLVQHKFWHIQHSPPHNTPVLVRQMSHLKAWNIEIATITQHRHLQSLSKMFIVAVEMWISTSWSEDESSTKKYSVSSKQLSELIVNKKQISSSPPTLNIPVSTVGESKSLPSSRVKTLSINNFPQIVWTLCCCIIYT